jgi:hypothetical protein
MTSHSASARRSVTSELVRWQAPNFEAAMSVTQWLGIGSGLVLLAFLVFAFRRGERVKRSGNDPPQVRIRE